MKREQRRDRYSGEIDEHDQPTEPMPQIIFWPSSLTALHGGTTLDSEEIPTPMPHEQPFPQQYVPPLKRPGQFSGAPGYPVLPAAPAIGQGGRPAGGTLPAYPESSDRAKRRARPRPKRSPIPLFVGTFFVAVQLLLLICFVLKLIEVQGNRVWINIIFDVSGLFLLPFRLLVQNIASPIPISVEMYTLLAILIYGLFARILVGLLKAILHSR